MNDSMSMGSGYAVFAGNGKTYSVDGKSDGWTRACRPIQHGDTMTVHLEWMRRTEFESLYGAEQDVNMKEEQSNGHSNTGNEWVTALWFERNKDEGLREHPPKGSVFCLSSSASYKLAVSSALRRWEIEWISSKWTEGAEDTQMQQAMGNEE